MIHSRPGFAPRRSDSAPAKLNKDMIPALHRKAKITPDATPLQESLQARADDAYAKLVAQRALEDAQAIAARSVGPEILVNPTPSEPPVVLEPGK